MRFYKALLLKAYFDKGLGLTNYIKYFLALFALGTQDIKTTLIFAFIYGLLCFILGYFWYKYDLIKTENEVANRFNPFCNDMRRSIKKTKL